MTVFQKILLFLYALNAPDFDIGISCISWRVVHRPLSFYCAALYSSIGRGYALRARARSLRHLTWGNLSMLFAHHVIFRVHEVARREVSSLFVTSHRTVMKTVKRPHPFDVVISVELFLRNQVEYGKWPIRPDFFCGSGFSTHSWKSLIPPSFVLQSVVHQF